MEIADHILTCFQEGTTADVTPAATDVTPVEAVQTPDRSARTPDKIPPTSPDSPAQVKSVCYKLAYLITTYTITITHGGSPKCHTKRKGSGQVPRNTNKGSHVKLDRLMKPYDCLNIRVPYLGCSLVIPFRTIYLFHPL